MTKNSKAIAIIAIVAVLVVIGIFVARDYRFRSGRTVSCADGSHPMIDPREFATQYWAYSAKLEVDVADKAKGSAELDPKVLTQVSKGLQEAREFREYIVAGYNACAIKFVDGMTVGFLRAGGPERVKHGSLGLLQIGQSKYGFSLGAFRCVATDHTSGLLSRNRYGLSG